MTSSGTRCCPTTSCSIESHSGHNPGLSLLPTMVVRHEGDNTRDSSGTVARVRLHKEATAGGFSCLVTLTQLS
jgi:hypothetical protein